MRKNKELQRKSKKNEEGTVIMGRNQHKLGETKRKWKKQEETRRKQKQKQQEETKRNKTNKNVQVPKMQHNTTKIF